jgi:hypothetical protein
MEQNKFIETLLASLLGLIPLIATALLNWLDKRSRLARKEEEIDFAQRRISFLSNWLQAREQTEVGEESAMIKKNIAEELDGIKKSLDPILLQPHIQPIVKTSERHFFLRLFLLYPPHKMEGWVYRGLFFMCLSGIVFFAFIALYPDPAYPLSSKLLGSVCLAVPFLLMAVVFHFLATGSDRKEEAALSPASGR